MPFLYHINNCEITDTQTLMITFNKSWYQEDIETLSNIILSRFESIEVIEKTHGADRETIRCCYNTHCYFLLQFEYYSQSCWIEGETTLSSGELNSLLNTLGYVVPNK